MKNITNVIKKTATDLNLPEDQVNAVVMAYWNEIYRKLNSLESTTVTIRHVGSFTISKRKLYSLINKFIFRIKSYERGEPLPFSKPKEKELEVIHKIRLKLRKALEKRNILANHYYKKRILDEHVKNHI